MKLPLSVSVLSIELIAQNEHWIANWSKEEQCFSALYRANRAKLYLMCLLLWSICRFSALYRANRAKLKEAIMNEDTTHVSVLSIELIAQNAV